MTTVVLANTSITSHCHFCVVSKAKIYSAHNFYMYNTTMFPRITMKCTRTPGLIPLLTGNWHS